MIEWLALRDYAIVPSLELDLGPGLTVLTGETGAGKSIIVDALALLLGARADTDVVRPGCAAAEIQGRFVLPADGEAAGWLRDNELDDDGECLLRRVVAAEKPSRGFINGRAVPIQSLRDLGARLADIHGQHEHQSLLRGETQRQLLDDYAGHGEAVMALAALSAQVRDLRGERDRLQGSDDSARIELLRHQLAEMETIAPREGEYAELDAEQRRLGHASDLALGAQEILSRLHDDEHANLYQELGRSQKQAHDLAAFDPGLQEPAELLDGAAAQLAEAVAAIRHCAQRYDVDPAELDQIQGRLGELHGLARKHRVTVDELPAIQAALDQDLARLESDETRLRELDGLIDAAVQRYAAAAATVSAGRERATGTLGTAVSEEMENLGLVRSVFEAALVPDDTGSCPPHGPESVQFRISTNPGQPLMPLRKVASGGELSRISLALQVVLAEVARVPTLVFDEVDVGVGGRVGDVVGASLHRLGGTRQVICITHLPQVAAQGDRHLAVRKDGAEQLDVTVATLESDDRVDEIARMLGGSRITERAVAHARELLGCD